MLRDLLDAAMEVTDVGGAPDDGESLQIHFQPQHTVGGRVLRTQIQGEILGLQPSGGVRAHGLPGVPTFGRAHAFLQHRDVTHPPCWQAGRLPHKDS